MMADKTKDWVRTNAERFGDAPALENVETGERYTWKSLDKRVGVLAGVLAQKFGIDVGSRVLVIAEGDTRIFEIQFACMRLGAILVPLNWRLTVPELVQLARDVEPAVVLCDGAWQETAVKVAEAAGVSQVAGWRATAEVPDLDECMTTATPVEPRTDLSMELPTHILHTSGTTGHPKGAITTIKSLTWQLLNTMSAREFTGPGTKLLNPMPLFHAGGLSAMANPLLLVGGAVATMRRFDAERVIGMIGDPAHGITHLCAPPVMWSALAEQPAFGQGDYSAMRVAEIAGGVPSAALIEMWRAHGVVLQQSYGGTELGPAATLMPRDAVVDRPTSAGLAVPFSHVRLVTADGADAAEGEVGEVWIKGPSVTPGYWRNDRTIDSGKTDDGWFPTGDAARRDAEGFYYLVDRIKDMYKSGGENVSSAEVERVIALHPHVVDVAVIGIPDDRWGEVGRAFVVLRPSAEFTLETLRAHCVEHIAKYKAPHQMVIVDDLPRNATGKISKATLRGRVRSSK